MRVLRDGRAARAKLAGLGDVHRGETCIILGNGPSLSDLELERLDGIPTFCLNRGYLLWQGSGRTPTYYVAANELLIDQFHDEIAALPCPLFLPWIYRERFKGVSRALFFETRTDQRFITDATRGVAPCGTVTVAALQLAYHLGFSSVILLGVDHRYRAKGLPHTRIRQDGIDQDHFHESYFADGTSWHLPDLRQSERGYAMARSAFEAADRRVVNATPGSALDVFRRGRLDRELRRRGAVEVDA